MKKIKLIGENGKGKYAIVDDNDFEWLNQWKWYFHNQKYARGRTSYKYKYIYMHRLIMNTPKKMDTDHINGNGLDNKRNNLRICTISQNNMNRKMNSNNTSGFKGVSWYKRDKKWMTQIKFQKKNIRLGCFIKKIDAINTYNQKAIELFGKFARLNII